MHDRDLDGRIGQGSMGAALGWDLAVRKGVCLPGPGHLPLSWVCRRVSPKLESGKIRIAVVLTKRSEKSFCCRIALARLALMLVGTAAQPREKVNGSLNEKAKAFPQCRRRSRKEPVPAVGRDGGAAAGKRG